MTVMGLMNNNDETSYREEVEQLVSWCNDNNLSLNVDTTKEIVVDLRRTPADHSLLFISGSTIESGQENQVSLPTTSLGLSTPTLQPKERKGKSMPPLPAETEESHCPSLPPSTEAQWPAEWFGNCKDTAMHGEDS